MPTGVYGPWGVGCLLNGPKHYRNVVDVFYKIIGIIGIEKFQENGYALLWFYCT